MVQPPSDVGPPPYEAMSSPQPGFIPPSMPAESSMPCFPPGKWHLHGRQGGFRFKPLGGRCVPA